MSGCVARSGMTANPASKMGPGEGVIGEAGSWDRPSVERSRLPRHVAIIMDGNGRWARSRGLDRVKGHEQGALGVRPIVEHAGRLGIEVLTLYSFSVENWKRPAEEVGALMRLYTYYMERELETLMRENIRFRQIGRREGLPGEVLDAVDRLTEQTRHNTAATLCLAVNYGGRAELTDAVRRIAERVAAGELDPSAISESTVAEHLYTSDLPDPDLLIRTAGEQRVSNYLLWQISYAELYVTQTLWPDFTPGSLNEAIEDYAGRTRRFGGLAPA